MTSFNIRPDDVGIRNLRNENLKPHATKPTSATAPYPEVHPIRAGFHEAVQHEVKVLRGSVDKETEQTLIPAVNEKRGEKRHFERRQQQTPVLLDTRSNSERRQLNNNSHVGEFDDTTADKGNKKIFGIDLYS